jgi:hypothetical protein
MVSITDHNDRHEYILELINSNPDLYKDFWKDWGSQLKTLTLDSWLWVYPQRDKWRLSHRGFLILDHYFKVKFHHAVINSNGPLTGYSYLAIDRYIKSPYFIKSNNIFFSDEKLVIELKLFYNGEIERLIHTKINNMQRNRCKSQGNNINFVCFLNNANTNTRRR